MPSDRDLRASPNLRQRVRLWSDALAYSSLLAAGVAGALAAAASLAFDLPLAPWVVVLAFSGTLVVYNVDRIRDLEQDRQRAPLRSAFVERHRKRLLALTLVAALASGISALQIPPAAWGLCAGVLTLGLLHRRLKHIRGIKTFYLTISWLAVVLGLPLLGSDAHPAADSEAWVFAILGCAIVSNLLASNLDRSGGREGRGGKEADEGRRRVEARSRLGFAIVVAGLGVGTALVGPDPLRSLVLIPLAELLVLCRYRVGEHYGQVVIDGALLAGACGAIALQVFTRAAA